MEYLFMDELNRVREMSSSKTIQESLQRYEIARQSLLHLAQRSNFKNLTKEKILQSVDKQLMRLTSTVLHEIKSTFQSTFYLALVEKYPHLKGVGLTSGEFMNHRKQHLKNVFFNSPFWNNFRKVDSHILGDQKDSKKIFRDLMNYYLTLFHLSGEFIDTTTEFFLVIFIEGLGYVNLQCSLSFELVWSQLNEIPPIIEPNTIMMDNLELHQALGLAMTGEKHLDTPASEVFFDLAQAIQEVKGLNGNVHIERFLFWKNQIKIHLREVIELLINEKTGDSRVESLQSLGWVESWISHLLQGYAIHLKEQGVQAESSSLEKVLGLQANSRSITPNYDGEKWSHLLAMILWETPWRYCWIPNHENHQILDALRLAVHDFLYLVLTVLHSDTGWDKESVELMVTTYNFALDYLGYSGKIMEFVSFDALREIPPQHPETKIHFRLPKISDNFEDYR